MTQNNPYNPPGSSLRQHQLRMLEILKELDRICQKHHIEYWLSSGTLLGAARHKGFIPWDDDLDVEMRRKDYLKLIKILPGELSSDYCLQTHATDPYYVAPYAKIRDKHSIITEGNNIDKHYLQRGIYIDVFQLEPSYLFLVKATSLLHGSFLYKPSRSKRMTKSRKMYLKLMYGFLTGVVYPIARLFGRTQKKKLYQTYGSSFSGVRNLVDLYPLRDIDFEGYKFKAPANYDAYLHNIYGDYMKIPDTIHFHTVDVQFDPVL